MLNSVNLYETETHISGDNTYLELSVKKMNCGVCRLVLFLSQTGTNDGQPQTTFEQQEGNQTLNGEWTEWEELRNRKQKLIINLLLERNNMYYQLWNKHTTC